MRTRTDRVLGFVVAAAGVALTLAVAEIEVNERQSALSAQFFPRLLAASLIVLGAALALRPGARGIGEVLSGLLRRRGLLVAGIFLIYCLTFRYVDFRFGVWAFTISILWILGSRKAIELILVPLILSAAAFAIFRHGFMVLLPTWT